MLRRYGRKIPAPLPAHRMISRVAPTIPPVIDLRQWCGPIKDQGDEGSCTAHAGTSAVEWIYRKYLNGTPIFSPQYTYAEELMLQGDFPQDDGSDGVTLCNTLIANGCCPLDLYAYVPGQIDRPTPAQDQAAALFRMGAYHGLTGSQVALSVLGDPVPWPVEIGFTVYDSFESNAVALSGVYNPKPGEQIVGGHEVLGVGYDVGTTPTLRPADCPPALLIQNSWGYDWGWAHGFFWMPLSVVDDPQTDLKIAHSGHPWK